MWEIRVVTDDEIDLFRKRLARGFGHDADISEGAASRFLSVFESDRMFGVFDEDDIVGTGGAFSLGLTVPGGETVPMGGTTMVTVQPTHRRRGILRELMSQHLDEVAGRGEPIAGLWASESTIYSRFGYGPASFRHNMEIEADSLGGVRSSDAKVRLIDADEAASTLPDVYESVRSGRPGMFTRSADWWTARVLADSEDRRGGKSAQRHLVHETDGSIDGYAIYRQKSVWENFVANGEVDLIEVITNRPEARRGIWAFLTNIDLFPKVNWWNAPVDDPLPMQVDDSRRVSRALSDALWIRVMDVPAALEAREYEHDGELTLGIHDGNRAATDGRFRLEVVDGKGLCQPTEDKPDVEFDISVLGHLYLGGGNAVRMAAAARIDGDQAAISTLHRLFRTDEAPWCPEIF